MMSAENENGRLPVEGQAPEVVRPNCGEATSGASNVEEVPHAKDAEGAKESKDQGPGSRAGNLTICPCFREMTQAIEAKMLEPESPKPRGGELKGVSFGMVSFTMKGPVLTLPATIDWEVNGKGRSTTMSVIASYCPFCGKAMERSI